MPVHMVTHIYIIDMGLLNSHSYKILLLSYMFLHKEQCCCSVMFVILHLEYLLLCCYLL